MPNSPDLAARPVFEEDFRQTLLAYRSALIEVFMASGEDLSRPLQAAKRLQLKKNLVWRISNLVQAKDPFSVFPYLPSSKGILELIARFDELGVPASKVTRVRQAMAEFEAMVSYHAGDRPTLELILDSVVSDRSEGQPLMASRKAAFRGNCGVWGIHAQARVLSYFLAPNAERPELGDLVLVTGILGLRRYREGSIWPLARLGGRGGNVDDSGRPRELALDPDYQGEPGLNLLPDFCSSPIPPIRTVKSELGFLFELAEGPIGNGGASDIFLGSCLPGLAPLYATPGSEHGAFEVKIDAPVKTLQSDIVIHRDTKITSGMEWLLAGRLRGELRLDQDLSAVDLLPLGGTPQRVGHGLSVVGTSLAPAYTDLCRMVHGRMGWDPEDFFCYRLVEEYPPLTSSVCFRFALPPAQD